MKKPNLSNRLEIRVDVTLLKNLEQYCSKYNVKQSKVLRDAIALYIEHGSLKYLLLEWVHQDAQFRKTFKKFLMECPKPLNLFFEGFLGPEEEKNVSQYAPNLPGAALKIPAIEDLFVTIQGKKAYIKRCGKNV